MQRKMIFKPMFDLLTAEQLDKLVSEIVKRAKVKNENAHDVVLLCISAIDAYVKKYATFLPEEDEDDNTTRPL